MSEARRKFVEGRRRKHNKRRRTKSDLAQEKKTRGARDSKIRDILEKFAWGTTTNRMFDANLERGCCRSAR